MENSGPPNEAVGRITRPERYNQIAESARSLIERLERRYLVSVERSVLSADAVRRKRWGHVGDDYVIIRPRSGAQVEFAFTDFPGVLVRYGQFGNQQFPACGCDACNESPSELSESLNALVGAIVGGGLTEKLTRRRVHVSVLARYGEHAIDRKLAIGEWKKLGDLGERDWQPWSLRPTALA